MKEILIQGPPGTGKTSKIQEIVRAMLQKRIKNDEIALTSFTKTGAIQLAKGSAVPRTGIGTLHSFAFRALGLEKDKVAESQLDDWNKNNPGLQLSGGAVVNLDDGGAVEAGMGQTDADEYLAQMGILRARCIDRAMWPPQVKRFGDVWEFWKKLNDFVDFADMIELALQIDTMPVHYNDNSREWAGPRVLFGDEFQDFTKAERKLFDHWGQNCELVLKVGDADQTLYHFKGADPDGMYRPDLADMQKRVLSQSHRVPEEIHYWAQNWIRKIKNRDDVIYKPRDAKGTFKREFPATFKNPYKMLDQIEIDLSDGLSVGVMASCGYMLQPAIAAMRQAGLPYCNNYRKTRGDWNPLNFSEGKVNSSQRLLAYLSPMWGATALDKWASILDSKTALVRGAKSYLDMLADDENSLVDFFLLVKIFQPQALAALLGVAESDLIALGTIPYDLLGDMVKVDPQVMYNYVLNSKKKALEYPLAIIQKRGRAELEKPINLEVGTIHSFKGGEFDSIYIIPDLSLKSARDWARPGPGHDAIIRQFYVALTRAKIKATILSPASNWYVRL